MVIFCVPHAVAELKLLPIEMLLQVGVPEVVLVLVRVGVALVTVLVRVGEFVLVRVGVGVVQLLAILIT